MTRFFPEYSYGSLPPRAQVRVGTGGYTEYRGSSADGGGGIKIGVIDNPADSLDAYGYLSFDTGHSSQVYTGAIYGFTATSGTYGQGGYLYFRPPTMTDNDWYPVSYGLEYDDSTGYGGRTIWASGVLDKTATNGQETITYWTHQDDGQSWQINYAKGYFWYNNPDSGSYTALMTLSNAGNLTIDGNLSKGTGTFDIPHPVVEGKRLRHSFIEGPQADLIYRGTITLGTNPTVISMDTEFGMAEGTWEALNCTPWSMAAASGKVVEWSFEGDTLTITGDEGTVCNWMVIGERHDPTVIAADCTDGEGRIALEYDQPEPVEHIWE